MVRKPHTVEDVPSDVWESIDMESITSAAAAWIAARSVDPVWRAPVAELFRRTTAQWDGLERWMDDVSSPRGRLSLVQGWRVAPMWKRALVIGSSVVVEAGLILLPNVGTFESVHQPWRGLANWLLLAIVVASVIGPNLLRRPNVAFASRAIGERFVATMFTRLGAVPANELEELRAALEDARSAPIDAVDSRSHFADTLAWVEPTRLASAATVNAELLVLDPAWRGPVRAALLDLIRLDPPTALRMSPRSRMKRATPSARRRTRIGRGVVVGAVLVCMLSPLFGALIYPAAGAYVGPFALFYPAIWAIIVGLEFSGLPRDAGHGPALKEIAVKFDG
jgi:hypothetical protein